MVLRGDLRRGGVGLVRRDWSRVTRAGERLVMLTREADDADAYLEGCGYDVDEALDAARDWECAVMPDGSGSCGSLDDALLGVDGLCGAYLTMLRAVNHDGDVNGERVSDDWLNVVADELQLAARGYSSLPGASQERLAYLHGGAYERHYYSEPPVPFDGARALRLVDVLEDALRMAAPGSKLDPRCVAPVLDRMRHVLGLGVLRPSGADRREALGRVEARYERQRYLDNVAGLLMADEYGEEPRRDWPTWYRRAMDRLVAASAGPLEPWASGPVEPWVLVTAARLIPMQGDPGTREQRISNVEQVIGRRPWTRLKYELVETAASDLAAKRRFHDADAARRVDAIESALNGEEPVGVIIRCLAVLLAHDQCSDQYDMPAEIITEDLLDEPTRIDMRPLERLLG